MFRKVRRAAALYRQLYRASNSGQAVLIYQMGKVGSTSLYHYLQSIDLTYPLFRIHRFRLDNDDYVKRGFVRNSKYRYWAWLQYKVLRRCKLKVICMTRTPAERNLSDFFQTISTFEKRRGFAFSQLSAEELQKIFLEEYPHHSAAVWFDQQVKDVFAIDVFNDKYDTCRNGSLLYRHNDTELLVFRLEDRDRCIHDVAEFLDIPDFELPEGNKGSNKWYAQAYKQVKALPLPQNYHELIESTDYYRFFYGSERFNKSPEHSQKSN